MSKKIITKKECLEIIRECKRIENDNIFRRDILGIYFWLNSNNKIEYFISCKGQGILNTLYNNKVKNIFLEYFDLFDGYTTIKDKSGILQYIIEENSVELLQ